jgi:carotenoid cleavage dioxygenase-like enzyme
MQARTAHATFVLEYDYPATGWCTACGSCSRAAAARGSRRARSFSTAGSWTSTGVPTGAVLRRYDSATGDSQVQELGPQQVFGECVFIPRGADPSETAGWLVGLVHDSAQNSSDLVVLDAGDFGGPPLARVRLPQRVPYGFHGSWVART